MTTRTSGEQALDAYLLAYYVGFRYELALKFADSPESLADLIPWEKLLDDTVVGL